MKPTFANQSRGHNEVPVFKMIVWNFLNQKGVTSEQQKEDVLQRYAAFKNLIYKPSTICVTIRQSPESWDEFREWFNTRRSQCQK